MNSALHSKARGSALLMTLMMTAVMTSLALTGLQRTHYQSQLAANLTRQALLEAEARRTLAAVAREPDISGHAQAFTPGCPPQCNWQTARRTSAANGVTAAYIAQLTAPGSNHFLIVARAAHTDGSEALGYALFNGSNRRFHFIQ